MKKIFLLGTSLIYLLSLTACSDVDKETPPDQGENFADRVYELVWQEEFNEQPNAAGILPLPSEEWWFETGNNGWGNNEPQYYVDRVLGTDTVTKIKDGNLVITAHKLDTPHEGSDYISARMNTKKSWLYGKFEMRAKVPGGKGTWAAFWMLPKNFQSWPLDGEIDIMEYVGYRKDVTQISIHTEAYNHKIKTEVTELIKTEDAEDDYHIYVVEWQENEILGYVDDQLVFMFQNDKKGDKTTWPFNQPFYLKLNLAIGGDFGGSEGIENGIFPAEYVIDYVRVYKLKK